MGIDEMAHMAGCDGGVAKRVKVGDRVQHYGTRQWGTVLEVKPQHDGTAELRIKRDPPRYAGDLEGEGWWATYHVRALVAGP